MCKLKEIISMIRIILDHVHEGVVICDKDGFVVYVNEANHRITGMNNKNILEKRVQDVVPQSSLVEVIKTGKEKLGIKTRVGQKYVISNIVPILEEGNVIGGISIFIDITELEELSTKLKKAEEHITHLSEQLSGFLGSGDLIVGKSPLMQKIYYVAQKAAGFNSNVLVTGESGTGKEVLARFIHNTGLRQGNPFIAVNCSAIPEPLLESELFGYEPGAFTGAGKYGKAGIFELGEHGTIFLDEIGDMPLSLQVKLLRLLQEKEIRRLGGKDKIQLDVRVIAATNKPLKKMVADKTFREDLFYRLNVIEIDIPPLRARKEDLPLYINLLLEKLAKQMGKPSPAITPGALKLLLNYDYPGNIRELSNILEKCLVMDEDALITIYDLPELFNDDIQNHAFYLNTDQRWPTMKELEKKLLEKTLQVYPRKTQAAAILGISRATLYRKLEEHALLDALVFKIET